MKSKRNEAVNKLWIKKHDSRQYRNPPPKQIINRTNELSAIEQFIADKGVTICAPNENIYSDTQQVSRHYHPSVIPS